VTAEQVFAAPRRADLSGPNSQRRHCDRGFSREKNAGVLVMNKSPAWPGRSLRCG